MSKKELNIPNLLTVSRIAMIIVFMVLATISGPPGFEMTAGQFTLRLITCILAIITGITDFLDGYLARKWNQVTDFGKLMDPLADKIFITAIMLFFVEFGLVPAWIAVAVIAREFLVTGLRMLGSQKGQVISADRWGKLKTLLQMLVLVVGGLGWMNWLDLRGDGGCNIYCIIWNILLWLMVIVTVGSGVGYFIKNRSLIMPTPEKK